jgi:UDP-N-acetylglucosamine transferase subunit ALG13
MWKFEEHQVKISNKFSALGNVTNNININGTLANIIENIKTSAKHSLRSCDVKVAKTMFCRRALSCIRGWLD